MKELTKAEEQVMNYLWKIKKGFLKDIIDQFPDPKPAYTTVSTVIRVLVKKGFIDFNNYSKVHEYYPVVQKNEYSRFYFKAMMNNLFSNSTSKFVSFFSSEKDVSLSELEEMKRILDEQIENRKKEL